MTNARLSLSSLTKGPSKKKDVLAGNLPILSGGYESIATVTVGAGGTSAITFSSIPSTYKHLQIRGILRRSDADTANERWFMRFNGDTATNYSFHEVYGNGTSAATNAGTSATYIQSYGVIGANGLASTFSGVITDILDYSDTNKYKTSRSLTGYDANGGAASVDFVSGNWRSTTAINSITLTYSAGWAQYSQLALYGIK